MALVCLGGSLLSVYFSVTAMLPTNSSTPMAIDPINEGEAPARGVKWASASFDGASYPQTFAVHGSPFAFEPPTLVLHGLPLAFEPQTLAIHGFTLALEPRTLALHGLPLVLEPRPLALHGLMLVLQAQTLMRGSKSAGTKNPLMKCQKSLYALRRATLAGDSRPVVPAGATQRSHQTGVLCHRT